MNAKPGSPGEERRKHKRASDIFIVTYRLASPFDVDLRVGPREYAAVAMDISEGGMGVDTGQAVAVSARVRMNTIFRQQCGTSSAAASFIPPTRRIRPKPHKAHCSSFTNTKP